MKVVISSRSFGKINNDAINLLKKSGLETVINPHGKKLSEEEILDLIDENVVGIIAGTEKITEKIITNTPKLKVISRYGVGMENVDLKTAKQKEILVYNTPETPALAVAELTLTLMLSLLKKINKLDRHIREDKWKAEMGNLLTNKKIGILGLGRIGKKLVEFLKPFECSIYAYDIKPDREFVKKHNIKLASAEELIKNSDVITLHLPITEETKNIISVKELDSMKKNTILINTARGQLLDEKALYNTLKEGKIAGAAIDAFQNEPYKGELTRLDNVILTPHIGTATVETRIDMELEATTKMINGLKEKKVL